LGQKRSILSTVASSSPYSVAGSVSSGECAAPIEAGKPHQACQLLVPVYGLFTEGFDTLDLKEAKALLQALAAA
jgi:hypothetical protein